jgi:hypothetical protein
LHPCSARPGCNQLQDTGHQERTRSSQQMTSGHCDLGADTSRPGYPEQGCITVCRRIVECGDAVNEYLPYGSMSG